MEAASAWSCFIPQHYHHHHHHHHIFFGALASPFFFYPRKSESKREPWSLCCLKNLQISGLLSLSSLNSTAVRYHGDLKHCHTACMYLSNLFCEGFFNYFDSKMLKQEEYLIPTTMSCYLPEKKLIFNDLLSACQHLTPLYSCSCTRTASDMGICLSKSAENWNTNGALLLDMAFKWTLVKNSLKAEIQNNILLTSPAFNLVRKQLLTVLFWAWNYFLRHGKRIALRPQGHGHRRIKKWKSRTNSELCLDIPCGTRAMQFPFPVIPEPYWSPRNSRILLHGSMRVVNTMIQLISSCEGWCWEGFVLSLIHWGWNS